MRAVKTLREQRTRRLLTLRALARQAGVAPRTLLWIEQGRTVPQLGTIGRIAAALGVEPGQVAEFRRAMARHAGTDEAA